MFSLSCKTPMDQIWCYDIFCLTIIWYVRLYSRIVSSFTLTDPVVVLMRRVVADCGVLCRQHEFRCSSGRCVLFLHRCDGHDDCGDYSDERGCVCAIGELQCPGDQCVSAERVCDGHRDCPSGIDELICPVKGIHAKTGFALRFWNQMYYAHILMLISSKSAVIRN